MATNDTKIFYKRPEARALAELSPTAHLVQTFDSTVARAHVSAAGAKGPEGQSRVEFSCKIHLKTDFDGLPIGFHWKVV